MSIERKRLHHLKAKCKIGLQKEETKNDDVEQCIIELIDAGVDEDEAQQICEDVYGD